MKAQVATAASCESRMLLKTISCIGRPQLGTGAVSRLLTNCPARPAVRPDRTIVPIADASQDDDQRMWNPVEFRFNV